MFKSPLHAKRSSRVPVPPPANVTSDLGLVLPSVTCDTSDFSLPPPSTTGDPLLVSMRLNVDKLSEIDTVGGRGKFTGTLVLTWTDARFKGWKSTATPPPDDTWGPWMRLANSVTAGDDDVLTQVEFEVLDCANGRMKRGIRVQADVEFGMALGDFPFDLATFTLRFMNLSHFRSKDLSEQGTSSGARSYMLVEVPEDDSEGKFSKLNWDGTVREWEIEGFSYDIEEKQGTAAGSEVTLFHFRIHLSRKYSFYVWKTLFPNFVLGMFTFLTPFFPREEQGDRVNYVATLLLSTLALLFVVGDSLPKLDSPTLIDKCMIVTMALEIVMALNAVIVSAMLDGKFGALVDTWLAVALLVSYLVVNIILIRRVVVRRRSHRKEELDKGCMSMLELQGTAREKRRKSRCQRP